MTDLLDLSALQRLLEVIGGDAEDFDELRDEFLETSPALIETLNSGATTSDLDAMRIASHSLKGNARDFGATALADLCASLEAACKADEAEEAGHLVPQIAEAEQAAREALQALKVSDLG